MLRRKGQKLRRFLTVSRNLDTPCPQILRTAKNMMVAKSELTFTRYPRNLKTVEDSTVTNSLQSEFDTKEMYTLRIEQTRFESAEKRSACIIFECSCDAVFTCAGYSSVSKSSIFKISRQKSTVFM